MTNPSRCLGETCPGTCRPASENPARLIRPFFLSLVLHGLALSLPTANAPSLWALYSSRPAPARLTVLLKSSPLTLKELPPGEIVPKPIAEPATESIALAPARGDEDVPIESVGLVPPYFPMKVLSRLPEALSHFGPEVPDTPEARAGGRIEIRLWLDKTGRVDRVSLIKTNLPEVLAESALAAFRRMLFRPGEIQGQPVASWSDIVVEFDPILTRPGNLTTPTKTPEVPQAPEARQN